MVCVFSNNEEIEATLVGTDPMTNIAVLKLDNTKHQEFQTVAWGDSAAIAVGDTVLAMGSPLALSQSVTRGIISNAKMTMPTMFAGSVGSRWRARTSARSSAGSPTTPPSILATPAGRW